MWDAVLFDLDGTFLFFKSSEEDFYRVYFSYLGEFCKDVVEPDSLLSTVQKLVRELSTDRDEKRSNYEKFLHGLSDKTGFKKQGSLKKSSMIFTRQLSKNLNRSPFQIPTL